MSKPIQSVDRALTILEMFNERNGELGILEVSERMELPKSTVHGIIKTLVMRGYLIQNSETKKYKLGIRLFELGNTVSKGLDIKEKAGPYLKEVFSQTGETVHLVQLENNEAFYVDKHEGDRALRMYSQVGKKAPLYCTGVGKAILAHLDKEMQIAILQSTKMEAYTEKTILDKTIILEELEKIKESGYATDDEEIEMGLFCVAAPIFDSNDRVIGSVSTAGPKFRFAGEKIEIAKKCIKEAARSISREMGSTK
ncbi:IclR family transcriptional regulator [Sporosarcina sp. ACRSM]|uniref:IclR family transcriptional regulator n=1 Tax=Sporosarcina sp. ACRSM TaxID=2918216 RepID=UPI001EF68C5B|nr:IclR family transcriptional regulator [Sporosarcina sp. ACRSM]MCG7334983.1 IclR family transcriptional regulator [Sporosarcina sp. ACRSM]